MLLNLAIAAEKKKTNCAELFVSLLQLWFLLISVAHMFCYTVLDYSTEQG